MKNTLALNIAAVTGSMNEMENVTMRNKRLAFILTGISILLLAGGFGVEWSIDLESGKQNYKRSMFWNRN